MGNIPDTVIVAVIMAVPTLLVYFGSRKKQKAETDDVISSQWTKLNKAQNDFTDQMEDRMKTLNDRIAAQDIVIAKQNDTIAAQNQTIAAQSKRISEQDKIILEQAQTITDLTKQIEAMGGTPNYKKRTKG